MTKDEALKLALEALKQIDEAMPFLVAKLAQAAIKEALAQPEPWEKFCDSNCVWTDHHPDCKIAQRTWVGLTNNELQPIADEYRILFGSWVEDFARTIEAKLKEKNVPKA